MKTRTGRHWTAEEKLHIIEEARQTPSTVSEVCRRRGLATGQFYTWDNGVKLLRSSLFLCLEDSAPGSISASSPI